MEVFEIVVAMLLGGTGPHPRRADARARSRAGARALQGRYDTPLYPVPIRTLGTREFFRLTITVEDVTCAGQLPHAATTYGRTRPGWPRERKLIYYPYDFSARPVHATVSHPPARLPSVDVRGLPVGLLGARHRGVGDEHARGGGRSVRLPLRRVLPGGWGDGTPSGQTLRSGLADGVCPARTCTGLA